MLDIPGVLIYFINLAKGIAQNAWRSIELELILDIKYGMLFYTELPCLVLLCHLVYPD